VPGQRSELLVADLLLARVWPAGPFGVVTCDRGYSSRAWRSWIAAYGAVPCVPANRTHPRVAYDRGAHRRRNRVERLWGRLREWRCVSTRYEKTASSFAGVLYAAAALDWIRHILT
jgi:transposase